MKAEYVNHMGNDLSVVNAARVSFAKESTKFVDKDAKLIKYLAKHDHWTPFAHTAITLRMQAPVPIRTQCFKHKVGLTENEESRRYIATTPEYYVPTFRMQAENKKQGSAEAFEHITQAELQQHYIAYMDNCIAEYEAMLKDGVAEEQARFLLPQGCEVNWIWTGNLVSFANFVNKRTDPHAQLEIQLLAQEVSKIIQPLFPVSWEALTS